MKSKRLFISITCLLSVLAASGVIAAPLSPETPHKLGTLTPIGGLESSLIEDIVIQGNYAYASFAATLVVIDITDLTNMTRVASLRLGGQIVAIEATADYLYVCSSGGLWIVDISDPLAPEKAGFYPASWASVVAVQGDIACLVMEDGLELIDISIPNNPRLVGALLVIGYIYDVAISDGFVYLAGGGFDQDWGVGIVDISNPAQPVYAGVYTPADFPAYSMQIDVSNSTLYYLDSSGLQILDVSSPAAPALTGSLYFFNENRDLTLSGDTIYLATVLCLDECLGGFKIIDVSLPVSPTLVAEYSSNDLTDINSISAAGGYVFLTHPGEVQSLDATVPSSPILVDTLESPLDIPDEFVVAGDYAYINNYWITSSRHSLRIAEISNPSQPVVVGQFSTAGYLADVEVFGNTVILTEVDFGYPFGGSSAYFIDVSNPQDPVEIGRLDSPEGNYTGVGIQGSYAYLTWQMDSDLAWPEVPESRVYVLDISDPTDPREVGIYELPPSEPFHRLDDVVVRGSYAYVLADEGLLILDVSDPENPVKAGEYQEPYILDLVFSGDYLFLASCQLERVSILDNRVPTQPVEISTYEMDVCPSKIAIQEDLLYIAAHSGLFVLNVSLPTTPVLLATFRSQNLAWGGDVSANGNDIYFTGSEGFLILNLTGSISGVVRSPNRLPVSGVMVSASGGITESTSSEGDYLFEGLEPGEYSVTPSMPGYTFAPTEQQVTVPPSVVANFTLLPMPVSIELIPGITTTLVYTDTQGLPTSLSFHSGAVVTSTQVMVTPTIATDMADYAFSGHAFELAAYQGGVVVPGFAFSTPVSVTIQYSQEDIALVSEKEAMELWRWDGVTWIDASQSCSPVSAYSRDPENYSLSLPICQTGVYKLMGPTKQLYIPVIPSYE